MAEPDLAPGSIPYLVALDISGPDERDPYITCGSVGGFRQQWAKFEEQWRALLEEFGLPYLRMTDAMRFQGPFAKKAIEWGADRLDRRDQLLLRATEIARKEVHGGVMSFDTRTLSPKLKRTKHSKQIVFEGLVREYVYRLPEYTNLHFFCDNDEEVNIEFIKGLTRFKNVDVAYARRIAGITFFDDSRLAGLQAADMVAYLDRLRRAVEDPGPLEASLFQTGAPVEEIPITVIPPTEAE